MNLESQVASLDLSKRLKELGVKQESAFYWVNHYVSNDTGYGSVWELFQKDEDDRVNEHVAAFTVAELGEVLGPCSWVNPRYQLVGTDKHTQKGNWYGAIFSRGMGAIRFEADTEADARAKMLVYLIENKIITVEEINARLEAA